MGAEEQGISANYYQIVPRTLIFMTCNHEVLLIKGAPNKRLWANRYNGIGGHIERGEDITTAAKRELFEETGIAEVDLWLCGTVMIDAAPETGVGLFVFRGECIQAELKASSEGELAWVSIDRLQELELVEDLKTLLPVVLSQDPCDRPFSAIYRYNEVGKMEIEIY